MAEPLRLTEAHPDQHLKVARRLIKTKDYAAARQLIDQPLTDPRDESRRLRVLAEAWSEEGHSAEAAECLSVAHALRPNSYKTATAYLGELAIVDHFRAALRVYEKLAPRDRRRQETLWEMHFLYGWMGWLGHADQVRRRANVGTNFRERVIVGIRRVVRPVLLRLENPQREALLYEGANLPVLQGINYQSLAQRYELIGAVDRALLANLRARAWLNALKVLMKVAYPIMVGIALALFLLFGYNEGAVAVRLAAGLAGAGLLYLTGRKLWDVAPTYGRAAAAAGSLALGGLLVGVLQLRLADGHGFQALVGVALVGGAAMLVGAVLGGLLLGALYAYVQQRVSRRHAGGAVVAHLAEIVTIVGGPRGNPDYLVRKLETAARLLEREVPRQVQTYDERTTEWLSERCTGAAEALRHMKRYVLSPAGNGTEHLSRLLRQQLAALATDNWHNFVWREPPGKQARSRRATLISIVRVVVVALLPAGSLFAVSPWLDFGDGIFRWARLVVFGWAVLSVLVALDPGVRERIEMAVLLARGVGDKAKRERGQ